MKNKFFTKASIILLVGIFLLTACGGRNNQAAQSQNTGAVSTVTLTNSIVASGTLGASQLSALTWGTSGTVAQVNVKTGQMVKAGDVLAVLNENSVPADIVTAQSDLATAQRNLQNLQDSQSTQAAAQLTVVNAQKAVTDAQNAVASLSQRRSEQLSVDYYKAQLALAQNNLDRARSKVADTKGLANADPVRAQAVSNLYTANLNYNTALANLEWITGKPTDYDVNLAKANLAVATAQLADAQRNWKILQNGPDPVAIAAAKSQVDTAQTNVNKMSIIAPFYGQVLTVQTAAGNPVQSGDAAFEIVNPQTLDVNTQVDETIISNVVVGDPVDVSLTMLPNVTLKGKVAVINNIGTIVNGLVEYTVNIALDPTTQPVRFGATANATIYTGKPYSSLAVPIAAVQSDNTNEFVLLVGADGSTQRINVKSGTLSGNLVTITPASANSIKSGDQVALGSFSNNSGSSQPNGNFGGGGIRIPGGFGG